MMMRAENFTILRRKQIEVCGSCKLFDTDSLTFYFYILEIFPMGLNKNLFDFP